MSEPAQSTGAGRRRRAPARHVGFLTRTFLRGLVTILPIAVTIYVLWWVGTSFEDLAAGLVRRLLPGLGYVPGTGLVIGFALVFVVGLLMRAWVLQELFAVGERLLERVPLVKSIYGPLKDLSGFLGGDERQKGFTAVVLVDFAGAAKMVGFVTGRALAEATGTDRVSVYLPMSYQLGGFVVLVPRSAVAELDLSIEEAMRLVLTAGVGGRDAK